MHFHVVLQKDCELNVGLTITIMVAQFANTLDNILSKSYTHTCTYKQNSTLRTLKQIWEESYTGLQKWSMVIGSTQQQ